MVGQWEADGIIGLGSRVSCSGYKGQWVLGRWYGMPSVPSPVGLMLGTDPELRTFSYCLEILSMPKIHFENMYLSFPLFQILF